MVCFFNGVAGYDYQRLFLYSKSLVLFDDRPGFFDEYWDFFGHVFDDETGGFTV